MPEKKPESLHTRIRAARKAAGMSQSDLGRLLGVDSHTVYRYERQGITPPHDSLIKLGDAAGVTLDWLIAGRGEPPAPPAETHEESGTGTDEAA